MRLGCPGKKTTICIGENKGADQLRSTCEADKRLCFRYTYLTIPLLSKFKLSSLKPSSVTVQPGLFRTWSEPKSLVFARTGSYLIAQLRYQAKTNDLTKSRICTRSKMTRALYGENMSVQCIPHFYIAKLRFAVVCLFFYFCSKHRLWVHVRTATPITESMHINHKS